jgi:hypothetical protein
MQFSQKPRQVRLYAALIVGNQFFSQRKGSLLNCENRGLPAPDGHLHNMSIDPKQKKGGMAAALGPRKQKTRKGDVQRGSVALKLKNVLDDNYLLI